MWRGEAVQPTLGARALSGWGETSLMSSLSSFTWQSARAEGVPRSAGVRRTLVSAARAFCCWAVERARLGLRASTAVQDREAADEHRVRAFEASWMDTSDGLNLRICTSGKKRSDRIARKRSLFMFRTAKSDGVRVCTSALYGVLGRLKRSAFHFTCGCRARSCMRPAPAQREG